MPNVHYCLVVTSCDRHDLLRDTLESFIATCGIKPRSTVIVEDSEKPVPGWLRDDWHGYRGRLGEITWISNGARRGQVYSIDRAIAAIPKDIERVFWLEDDWHFDKAEYTETALEILDSHYEICQVVFRKDWAHPLIEVNQNYKVAEPNWKGDWGGWTWNPMMTRKAELTRFGTYGSQAGYVNGLKHEIVLSRKFLDAGFRIAALPFYCHHTGGARSRSVEPLPAPPKVLFAIPACKSFDYGKWEGKDGFHESGQNDRVEALRDTWLKDIWKFPNVSYKLFYGHGAEKYDEVSLGIPDDYAHLPHKTIAICRYAKEHDFDLMFKCDDDTGVYVDRVLQEGIYGQWDYAGFLNGRVCTGGTGYWLSKRAIGIIADHASPNYHWAEDVTVSHFLFNHNIQGVHLEGHKTGREDHWYWKEGFDPTWRMDGISSFHAVRPSDMRLWYAAHQREYGVREETVAA